eukprot:COSAG02_NODE_11840_length_1643_cov_20.665901_1_plen_66_part_10
MPALAVTRRILRRLLQTSPFLIVALCFTLYVCVSSRASSFSVFPVITDIILAFDPLIFAFTASSLR